MSKINNIRKFGYCRVSSHDQNLDRQVIAMQEVGIVKENIYCDYKSGKDFNRPQYNKLLTLLSKEDILFIASLDRLGRDYTEIIDQWKYLTKTLCIDIVVLDMPLLDTRNANDLTGTFIADLVLQILSYTANIERLNIRERQAQGIRIAKDKGVKFGRPLIELPISFEDTVAKQRLGTISVKEVLEKYQISKATYYRRIKQLNI